MSTERQYAIIQPLAYTGAASEFTYHCEEALAIGQLVSIPLGRRVTQGVVYGFTDKPLFKTRAISAVLPVAPLPTYLMELAPWLAEYYASSMSAVWSTFLPTGVAKQRRAGKTVADATASTMAQVPAATVQPVPNRSPGDSPLQPSSYNLPQVPLTQEQAEALAQISESDKRVQLIQGVTGSGKTRLYLELAAQALSRGQSVIVLVPEITLTPQVVSQFEQAFGDLVISTHSKLTEAQRHKIWTAASEATAAGQPRIVVGPRSCLFLPLHQLGLIVVDECHETSYKQEQHPRYAAVAVAARLGQLTGARVILGSATPGLAELSLANEGRIGHVRLLARANAIPAAPGIIIDLREKAELKRSKILAASLLTAIDETLDAGRQTLLYLNRRGSASSQVCGDCGHVSLCPNCQLPLTFHADWMRLVCHHCNFRRPNEAVCPVCNGMDIKLLGGGTKRVEAEVERLWPQARVARLDRDSATLPHIKAVFAGLKAGTIDIVIGTQMIAKGLDLPAIDTVGVVSADTMLHLPDYTAAERTFQLLSQVSGRAGRGDRAGQVFIQTYTPEHPAVLAAAGHQYDAFAQEELAQRLEQNYPPYSYLLKLTVTAASREAAIEQASRFAGHLRSHAGLIVTGPAPAFIETQGAAGAVRYHWVLSVKSPRRPALVAIARQLPGDHWTADLDPANLL